MDDNMFHISFESGILEDPAATPPESTHKYTKPLSECKSTPDDIQIFFEKGDPVKVLNLGTKEEASTPATILKLLNRLGGVHSIGRIDIVENRFVSAQHKFGIPIAFLILGRRCLCFLCKRMKRRPFKKP